MKKISILFIIFFLLFQANLFSQNKSENHLGIGISLDPSRIGHVTYYYSGEISLLTAQIINSSPYLFYVPININNKFRVEPVFGINSFGYENLREYGTSDNSYYSSTTSKSDAQSVTFGIGAFYLVSPIEPLSLYFGPRFFYYMISNTDNVDYVSINPTNTQRTTDKINLKQKDLRISIAFGAEYFPISYLSIGGEISINYNSYGNPEVEETYIPESQEQQTSNHTSKKSQHSFRTDGLFFLRWYFL